MNRGEVECVVCLENIALGAPTWSCGVCFAIVLLPCTHAWAKNKVDSSGNPEQRSEFPCLSCRSLSGDTKKLFHKCFCGGEAEA